MSGVVAKPIDPNTYADFDNRYLRHDSAARIQRAALTELPVVDISPFIKNDDEPARQRAAAQIREACINIGFFLSSIMASRRRRLTRRYRGAAAFSGCRAL